MSRLHFQNESEISDYQWNEVLKTLRYVKEKSPFYRKHFADSGSIENYHDFSKLPFTGKDQLQMQNWDFQCIPEDQVAEIASTSGTLGKPVFISQSGADLERLALNEKHSFELAGLHPGDRIQLMTTMDKRFMAGLAYYLGAQKLGAGMIRVGSGVPELQWDTILNLKPTVLIAVPSFVVRLIEYAEKNDIDFRSSSVKTLIGIGEGLRGPDLQLNVLGKFISDKWNLRLHSTYASTEMASAFTECEHGSGGHLIPEMVFAEVLDEQGIPVESGNSGEVVITTLQMQAMPLVRFKTGDICHVYRKKCECGRNTLRLGSVIGRRQQMIKFKGTTIYPPAIFEVLYDFQEISNFLVEVKSNEMGMDHLIVHIPENILNADIESGLKNRFQSKLRVVPELLPISHEELSKIQSPGKNRKPIKFLDNRSGRNTF